jgi:hypothetical protein
MFISCALCYESGLQNVDKLQQSEKILSVIKRNALGESMKHTPASASREGISCQHDETQ